jgi:hypothetical protein
MPLSGCSGDERVGGAIRIGPGVTPPRLLHKVEPQYFPDARADHIQGTVVLQLAVNRKAERQVFRSLAHWVSDWMSVLRK